MTVSINFLAHALRFLSVDAVQAAGSGHPGMPLGMADVAAVLWHQHLSHNPNNPHWPNRDRFVLSNGHGSMLLYALLHMTGYDLSLEDLKAFRQWGSRTPGHPEWGHTPGVETTTGPLGQGLANAVGFAMAQQQAAQHFNQGSYELIKHRIYAFAGDGCLMEGVSHEVCSLAGTLKIPNLIVFWDHNGISIDGQTHGWFAESVADRFQAYGWQVLPEVDGHNHQDIDAAIVAAQGVNDAPVLIPCRTRIGFGAGALEGTAQCHGAPLGDAAIKALRDALNWPHPPFVIPREIQEVWDARQAGQAREAAWQETLEAYSQAHPQLAQEWSRRLKGALPEAWQHDGFWNTHLNAVRQEAPKLATRKASQKVLDALGPDCPELLGGSADLTESNLTRWHDATVWQPGQPGQYLHYGVREFGMAAIMNGVALYGLHRVFGGTFLVFSDYMRNALRMAALMQLPVVHVMTHDSVALGEDGPTHQPIEHLAMLRATPNLAVWRPADAVETWVAWKEALQSQHTPSMLVLSRQGLPALSHTAKTQEGVARGAYVLFQAQKGSPDGLLFATGSEVHVCLKVAQTLASRWNLRVISMPCMERFLEQDRAYQEVVVPRAITRRIAVEAGASQPWYRWVGDRGVVCGLDRFGCSAPGEKAMAALGMDEHSVLARVTQCMEKG